MRRLVLVVCLAFSLSLVAANRKEIPTDFPLPSDYSIDFQLASSQRSHLNISPAPESQVSAVANKVFGDLVGTTMISGYGLPYHWQLAVTNDQTINAGSLPDGEVVVYGGLASMLGNDPGLWAAVLSHEVAHTARRHAVREYQFRIYVAQQQDYWRARAAAGDKSANWALLGVTIGSKIAEKKLSRDLEHDADITGMMLMARAGYHPDNVFAMHHLIRLRTGDESKFAAFFSTHPRWETRDQRDDKAYSDALAEYTRLWPDPAQSPGGIAPTVAFIGKPESVEQKQLSQTRIQIPIYCRNTTGPVTVTVRFEKDGRPVPSSDDSSRDAKGNLQIQSSYQCVDRSESTPFEASLSAGSIPGQDHKLKAQALISSNGRLLEESPEFEVHVPKSGRVGTEILASTRNTKLETNQTTGSETHGSEKTATAVEKLPERVENPTSGFTNQNSIQSFAPPEIRMKVEFRSDPSGASVELDGNPIGTTPLTVDIQTGQHVVSIRKPEFRSWERTIDVTSGNAMFAAHLERLTLTLQ